MIDKCSLSGRCGGCDYQGVPYEKQLKKKEEYIRGLLKGICPVKPITGMEDPYHYRNKVHAVFARKRDGSIISGVYEKKSHRVVPVDTCQIEDADADRIIGTIRELAKSFRIPIYDEDRETGLLRHVLIRKGHFTGEVLVVLVLASPVMPSKNNFVKALRKKHPEITSVVLNVNPKRTNMVLGDRNICLYGRGYIEDRLCDNLFRISPNSFYQINAVQTEKLYQKAIDLAGFTGKERVIDAYCGIGTIGLSAHRHVKEVIGVELNPDAVEDAKANVKRNGAKNVRIYRADAGKFMVDLARSGEKVDVVLLDPPRSGSDEAFLSSVVKLRPKKIVYISCGPESLTRDLKYLTKHGYRAEEAWPFDMFPFTAHVETVVLLSNRRQDL